MPLAPPVGVVIANHNNCAFVEKAIESVAHQTVRDLQVVVVDDASTDRSDEVIRRCLARLGDTRFRYVKLGTNLGQAGALRRGMAELDTPFVCFLDSDDLWYDDFVARHLAVHMNADFPVALTYCDSHIIDADDRILAGTAWWFDSDKPQAKAQRTIDAGADAGHRSGRRRAHLSAQRRRHLPSAVVAGGRHQHDGEHDVPARLRRSRARAAEPRAAGSTSTSTCRPLPA